jgi:hypothetical protein
MRVSLLLVAAFPLPLGARFLFAATPGAAGGGGGGGRGSGGETSCTAAESVTRGMAARGTGEEEAMAPARMQRTEPTGHARQPRSSTSRLTSSVESAAAAVARVWGGGGAALALTVERRGRRRSSELSASTITDCARLTSG